MLADVLLKYRRAWTLSDARLTGVSSGFGIRRESWQCRCQRPRRRIRRTQRIVGAVNESPSLRVEVLDRQILWKSLESLVILKQLGRFLASSIASAAVGQPVGRHQTQLLVLSTRELLVRCNEKGHVERTLVRALERIRRVDRQIRMHRGGQRCRRRSC